MKIYKVKVNGKLYEVEVESIEEKDEAIETEKAKKETPANDQKTQILAPMQGTILKLNVGVGSEIKKGDVLMVLESMKLENDILSPVDGYVSQALIQSGDKVSFNQLLLVIG